jgi:hypothetical protein
MTFRSRRGRADLRKKFSPIVHGEESLRLFSFRADGIKCPASSADNLHESVGCGGYRARHDEVGAP